MTKQEFRELVNKEILILDGATGSNLRAAGMPVGILTEQFVLEKPEVLQKLQKEYADAGSKIVYAPTFAGNPISFEGYDFGMEYEEVIKKLVSISKEAVGDRAFVAGDISTTGKIVGETATYEELFDAYSRQIKALVDAGVDLLVVETMITAEEVMLVLDAASGICPDMPVMCSFTVEADGSLLYGGNIGEAVAAIEAVGADAAGINCSLGPDQLEAVVSQICSSVSIPVLIKPNAGLPEIDEKGNAHYSMQPEQFGKAMKTIVDKGAKIVGGCCGTTPEHIRALCSCVR